MWHHCDKLITDIKFSPDDSFIAIASEDGNIYLYKSDDKRSYRRQAVCRGHTEPVTHIDFSANGKYLQSNGAEGDNSIQYWDMMGNLIKSHILLRDTNWFTWTCTFGFPVQGIYPPDVASSYVNSVHAVPEVGVLLSGDDNNLVNLFRYPSLNAGALRQAHIGHAGNVSQVRFSYNRRHAVSLGSTDRAILVWAHELEFQESDDGGADSSATSSGSSIGSGDSNLEGDPGLRPKLEKPNPIVLPTVVEPWRSCIAEPTNWLEELTKSNRYYLPTSSTDVDFEVVRLHGCRLADTRGSVRYTAAGTVAYFASSSCIVYNRGTETQRILHGSHTGPVVGLGEHPSGQVFATGELMTNPRIVLWSAVDARTISILENAHPAAPGVGLLAFSESGKMLASVGMDDDNTLVTHEWAKRSTIFRTPTEKGRGKVLCLCFLADGSSMSEEVLSALPPGTKMSHAVGGPPTRSGTAALGHDPVPATFMLQSGNIVVTGGEKHLKFWWSQGQNVKSQKCIWGSEKRQTITCVASASPMICVTGTKHGEILVWKNFKVELRVGDGGKMPSPHQSNYIQTIWCKKAGNGTLNPLYITGDNAGNIVVWEMILNGPDGKPEMRQFQNYQGDSPVSLRTSELEPRPLIDAVQSVCARDGVLLVATQSSDIYEVPFGIIGSDSTGGGQRSRVGTPSNRRQMIAASHYGEEFSGPLVVNPDKALHVVAGHMADIWGLVAHPKRQVYFTSGDDSTVRCWSLDPHRQIMRKRTPVRSRSLALTIDGEYLAVGSTAGPILIYKLIYDGDEAEVDMGEPEHELRDCSQMIDVIRFSPCGGVMAAASYDRCIYIRSIVKTETGVLDFNSTPLVILRGHTGHVSHFDFGVMLGPDEAYDAHSNKIRAKDKPGELSSKKTVGRKPKTEEMVLQSNDSSMELRYWRVTGGVEILSSMEVRDVVWHTFTCPLGWPVQGIYDADEDSGEKGSPSVNAVCRNNNWQALSVLAAADSKGRIRLFNYPCIVPGSPDKCYTAHSGSVSNLVFTFDDSFCVSVGRQDRCVVVWKTDIMEEIRERKALALDQEVHDLTTDNLYMHNQSQMKRHGGVSNTPRLGGAAADEQLEAVEDDFAEDRCLPPDPARGPTGGDESMAVKPWKGAVREPSTWTDKPDMGGQPKENLELCHVYGYRGWDCRNNMSHAHSSKEIIYHVAGAGIVYNIENHTQVINTSNDDDITCLSVHPEGHTVATGQIGKKPKIVLWDSNTGVVLRELHFHTRGVNTVCFSPTGRLLVSTGMDVDRTIVVHNVETGIVVGAGKIGKGISVLTLSVSSNGENMITAGKNHCKVWDMPSPDGGRVELSSKAGILNKNCKTVVSSAYLGVDAVTGMSDGNIYLWKGRSISRVQRAHMEGTPVTSMTSLPVTGSSSEDSEPRVLTGGKDGFVHIWNSQFVKQWSYDLKESQLSLFHHQVQSVSAMQGMLVVGTKAGELVEVNMLSRKACLLVESHFAGELWGLDKHPTKANYVTCGDDMTVRVWDAKARQQIAMTSVGAKARAVAYSPDGFQLAVGLFDGTVKVLQNNLQELKTVKVAKAWIQCMRFSSDLASLAVGAHDRNIYVLETRNYSIRAVCRGHHSYIKQLDFSADGSKLQSVSGDYEILFWNAVDGTQIRSPTSVRDEAWATWTCTLGWPVQGIWPSGADGTDINSVDRSPDGTLIASGDDFNTVKLFKYPCIKQGSKFLTYKGHSSHIPNVKFSSDGKWLFSIGGMDKSVMQFQVKRSNKR
jgi:microtubule-associated protein-like 6